MIQEMTDIDKKDLLNRALSFKKTGYRLAQICAVGQGDLTILYSFIKDDKLLTLRFPNRPPEPVDSISFLYSYAFLYENEMKDLFGVNMANMNIDFKGRLYETSHVAPFNPGESEPADPGESEPANPGESEPTGPGESAPANPGESEVANHG